MAAFGPKRAFAVRLTPMRPRWIIRPWRVLMDTVTLDYFREPGPHSTAKKNKVGLAGAPTDIADLATWIQGRMLHEHWASRYGEELTPERRELSQRRSVDAVLDGLLGGAIHYVLLRVARLVSAAISRCSRCRPCERTVVRPGRGAVSALISLPTRRSTTGWWRSGMVIAGGLSIFRSMTFSVQNWGWSSTLSTCRRVSSCWPPRPGNSAGVARMTPIALASSTKAASGSSPQI